MLSNSFNNTAILLIKFVHTLIFLFFAVCIGVVMYSALALQKLALHLGVKTVVVTGGGQLGGALLRAGLVDEVELELFPAIIGGCETPAIFAGEALRPGEFPNRLELLDCQVKPNGWLHLHYRVLPRAYPAEGP